MEHNKRARAITSLCPTAKLVLRVFAAFPKMRMTAHEVSRWSGLPLGTVTPRLAELDERGYGFIRECMAVSGKYRKQKCWEYRGDNAVLFNVTSEGRIKSKLSYRDLWMRERTTRNRLLKSVQ